MQLQTPPILSQALFETAFSRASAGLAVVDERGRLLLANPALGALLGAAGLPAIGSRVEPLIHPEDRRIFHTLFRQLTHNQRRRFRLVTRLVTPDAEPCWVQLHADRVPDGAVLTVEDARAWMRDQHALQASEERFRALFDRAPLSFLEVAYQAGETWILRANPHLCRLINRPAEALLGEPLASIVQPVRALDWPQIQDQAAGGDTVWLAAEARLGEQPAPVRLGITAQVETIPQHWIVSLEPEGPRGACREAVTLERRRIAAELHDGLAQDLLAISLRAGAWPELAQTDPAGLLREVHQVREQLRGEVIEVRRVIQDLRPAALVAEGFWPAVERLIAERLPAPDYPVQRTGQWGAAEIPEPLQPLLLRIIQEGVTNIARHAGPAPVTLRLTVDEGAGDLTLTISDHGRGASPAAANVLPEAGHFGLIQIRERVERAGGSFAWESRPGAGAALSVSLPLAPKKEGQEWHPFES